MLPHGLCVVLLVFPCFLVAQEEHSHSTPEQLGKVSFPISCLPVVQQPFERGVALLHSFAYSAAESAFRTVAQKDARCVMAHWGIAMSYFHQLWDPATLIGSCEFWSNGDSACQGYWHGLRTREQVNQCIGAPLSEREYRAIPDACIALRARHG